MDSYNCMHTLQIRRKNGSSNIEYSCSSYLPCLRYQCNATMSHAPIPGAESGAPTTTLPALACCSPPPWLLIHSLLAKSLPHSPICLDRTMCGLPGDCRSSSWSRVPVSIPSTEAPALTWLVVDWERLPQCLIGRGEIKKLTVFCQDSSHSTDACFKIVSLNETVVKLM